MYEPSDEFVRWAVWVAMTVGLIGYLKFMYF